MSRPFRFAVQATDLIDLATVRSLAKEAEALGYDEFYSSDHVGTAVGINSVDPLLCLIAAAGATKQLRVGPLVLNNEFHQPALLARAAISADQMTSGRFILGMGTGYAQVEHDAIGMTLLPPGERVTRLGESLRIVRNLCDEGSCSFVGEHHQIEIEDFGIRSVQQHIPFLIGGHGRRVVSLGAKHADIFQFTGLTHGPDGSPSGGGFAFDHIAERARWLSEAAGDRDGDIERSTLVQRTAIGAAAYAATLADARLDPYRDVFDDTPFMLCGSLEQVIDKIERLRAELNISHFVVRDIAGFAPVVEALAGK